MDLPLFRPPAEADSLIVRAAYGCPWNRCTFCSMYSHTPYAVRPLEDVAHDLAKAARHQPAVRRVFLADGDVMVLPFDHLTQLLKMVKEHCPNTSRISLYANGGSIMRKSDDELRALAALGLHTLYMGLESGCDEVLRRVNKRETAGEMIEACVRAQECGLRMSVMVLVGLGGRELTARHAAETAEALNAMQPRLLAALRCIPIPGTPLATQVARGEFDQLTEYECVRELLELVAELELQRCVFRANHSSNVVPLEARFPRDRQSMCDELQHLLASGTLDEETPGAMPLWM